MATLVCIRCGSEFETDRPRGYCDSCISAFRNNIDGIHAKQRPGDGIIADGKFSDERLCPQTIIGDDDETLCGLCGSSEIECGYGIGGGYGIGSYNFCNDCMTFLDFHEDAE